jgi:hypothetical protein
MEERRNMYRTWWGNLRKVTIWNAETVVVNIKISFKQTSFGNVN